MTGPLAARILPVVAGLILSAVFARLAFAGVDLARTRELLDRVAAADLLPALGVYAAMIAVRTERWRRLLGSAAPGWFATLRLFWIGAGALYVFPARIGEFARPALFARRGASSSYALATVALERLLDGAGQVTLLLLLLPAFAVDPWIRRGGMMLALLYLGFFALLVVAARSAERAERIIARLLAPWPALAGRASGAAHRFVAGLAPAVRPSTLLLAVLLTALAWALSIEFLRRLLVLFSLGGERPLVAAAFLQFMLTVGIVIPSAPGYLGTFHYFAAVSLAPFGAGRDEAAGFAILLHAASVALAAGPAALLLPFEWGRFRSGAPDIRSGDG